MKLEILKPNKSLNKAYFKQSLKREDIELFKTNLIRLFSRIDNSESEEHNKNIVSDFLKDTFYKTNYEINTAGRKDLVIHLGKTNSEPVAVIIEAKKPDDKAGMINMQKANAKSVHELIHYYLHERFIKNNKEIRNLIITDIYQWFIFDASEFERFFYNNKQFIKTYKDWHDGVLPSKNTDWFYQEIAKPFIDKEIQQLECTYFNLHEYEQIIKNGNYEDDTKLIDLFKILSPEHLLKLPFANDSNELNKDFYSELLHLIGLYERKEGSKKIIDRLPDNQRNKGSLIENTINILKTYNKLSNIEKINQYGQNEDEQLFSVSLELCITWLNRILFLKLLEGQLLKYNNNNPDYLFFSIEKIKDYNELSELFFDVLAIKMDERTQDIKEKYSNIPYLNSSLFEQTVLEKQTICINQLKDRFEIPVFSLTVLKDSKGKRQTGMLPVLKYLFEFLDSYNFASESSASIQEQNKNIINASVLGLIFEKINGYKDGSFFTPGIITMYMCKNAIRNAILNKFNAVYQFNCKDFDSLTNYLTDINKLKEYNEVVNSLRLCDPSVGSGHFLVSALNEVIAIKSNLGILCDRQNKLLKFYNVIVENDELIITDEEDILFEYNPKNKESQRIQEALFHEKQTIIENCLFGVDINPKSVHICRLRLWIELLKNAYYTKESNFTELETLPNIDINIKHGNSLISRFALNGAGFKNGQLQKMQQATQKYKDQVIIYKSTQEKKVKKNAEIEIARLKQEFAKIVNPKDKDYIELQKIETELASQTMHFSREDIENWKVRTNELTIKKAELQTKYDEKLNSIYGNSFEWRFEFPEVLDESGNFIGFDVLIGNPPYKMIQPHNTNKSEIDIIKSNFQFTDFKIDLFHLFFQIATRITKKEAIISYIAPSSFLNNFYVQNYRKYLTESIKIERLAVSKEKIFNDADVHNAIYFLQNSVPLKEHKIEFTTNLNSIINGSEFYSLIEQSELKKLPGYVWNLLITQQNIDIIKKISKNPPLSEISTINRGLITGDRDKYFSESKLNEKYKKILTGSDIYRYSFISPKEYVFFEKPKTAGGCWDKEVHLAEHKICIRQIGFEPIATIIEEPIAVTGNIFTIRAKTIEEEKLILAIINSKLIKYYWKIMFNDFKTTFPQVTIFSLEQIPIAKKANEQKRIIKLVNNILQQKIKDFNDNTSKLENEIDVLIYKLYDITPDEIKIIEKE